MTTPSEAPYLRPSLQGARSLAWRARRFAGYGGNIAVRFFAKHVDFIRSRAPKRDLEREPGKHGHDGIDDLVGQAGQANDGDRHAANGNAEEAGYHLADVILDHRPAEHETISRIAIEAFEAEAQPPEVGPGEPLVELAEPLLDDRDDVDDAKRRGSVGRHRYASATGWRRRALTFAEPVRRDIARAPSE